MLALVRRYYPMEHKYIALYPSKETAPYEHNDSDDDGDGGKNDVEKSAILSKKARAVALQRWAEDKQRVADGVAGAVDKVAHAMEVAYQGGAAVNGDGKEATRKDKKSKNKPEKAGKQSGKKQSAGSDGGDSEPEDDGSGSDSSSSSSSESGSDSDSESDDRDAASEASDRKTVPAKAPSVPAAKITGAKHPAKETKKAAVTTTTPAPTPAPLAAAEASDSEGDDFFVEEASDSELAGTAAGSIQPKVYNDGNAHRFKGDRMSVHEIRFAATKRKYERHKRVFNNQNKRADAQDRKKAKKN